MRSFRGQISCRRPGSGLASHLHLGNDAMFVALRSATAATVLTLGMLAHSPSAIAAFIFDSNTYGIFGAPNDVVLFSFTVGPGTSTVTLETFNYHAGSDSDPPFGAAGAATGGFDTVLSLFASDGSFSTDFQLDMDQPNGNFDARIEMNLAGPSTYYLTLTQYDNFFVGTNLFSDSTFLRDGQPLYTTAPIDPDGGLECFAYTDVDCNERQNAWKLGIDGAATATVIPLPAALPLLATALGGLGLLGWRRRFHQKPIDLI